VVVGKNKNTLNMLKLNVPYSSQWDSDASDSKDDCGPTCAKMCLAFYGTSANTNQIFERTGAGIDKLIGFGQLIKSISTYGYQYVKFANSPIQTIKEYLNKNILGITLIHYGDLTGRQDTYTGPHFVVVVGYDDNGYWIHDPDWWGSKREQGASHYWPKAEFEKAFIDSKLDGNPTQSFLIILPKGSITNNMEQLPKDSVIRDIRTALCGYFNDDKVKADLDSNQNILQIINSICFGDTDFTDKWVNPKLNDKNNQILNLQFTTTSLNAKIMELEQKMDSLPSTDYSGLIKALHDIYYGKGWWWMKYSAIGKLLPK
jgi:hypothetical protein